MKFKAQIIKITLCVLGITCLLFAYQPGSHTKNVAKRVFGAMGSAGVHQYSENTPIDDFAVRIHDIESRAQQLLNQMTLDEKASLLKHASPAIPRLDIPAYNWWSESLHGVFTWNEIEVTIFPQSIALASTWDPALIKKVAGVISDELRAIYHRDDSIRYIPGIEGSLIFRGLTSFTPNINIARDPRWGRVGETYGEDPTLTSSLATHYVQGLQGDDPVYFKIVATLKHFAAHSGPEAERVTYDTRPTPHDLYDTYFPAFASAIGQGGAYAVMCAYSRFNGPHACMNPALLTIHLRQKMGFTGYVVTDCGALDWAVNQSDLNIPMAEAGRRALEAGVHLECLASTPPGLEAVKSLVQSEPDPTTKQHLEELINQAVLKLLATRIRFGNIGAGNPYNLHTYPINSVLHRQLALEAARKSLVLLKNDNSTLPFTKNVRIAVIGPGAHDLRLSRDYASHEGNRQLPKWNIMFGGQYAGNNYTYSTPLMAIQEKIGASHVIYAKGFEFYGDANNPNPDYTEAVQAAQQSDAIVMVAGLDEQLEGEGVDRQSLRLPNVQDNLIHVLRSQFPHKPFALVLFNGGEVFSRYQSQIPALIEAWYPGEEGGHAIADVLFGDVNPSGKLPVTFYADESQLPDYNNYAMHSGNGRTYRYFTLQPLYEFGFGLSYTTFQYLDVTAPAAVSCGTTTTIDVHVRNAGLQAGDEIIQVYLSPKRRAPDQPLKRLVGFTRVSLDPGQDMHVPVTLINEAFAYIDDSGNMQYPEAEYVLSVGGRQPSNLSVSLGLVLQKNIAFGPSPSSSPEESYSTRSCDAGLNTQSPRGAVPARGSTSNSR